MTSFVRYRKTLGYGKTTASALRAALDEVDAFTEAAGLPDPQVKLEPSALLVQGALAAYYVVPEGGEAEPNVEETEEE